ncbi:hypothetical protein PENSPDRAFT_731949 [Peniophora sp. CONT]|nr:hypothetical protein PENSPDRAFT_731949 [Peniophora sp. CONT]
MSNEYIAFYTNTNKTSPWAHRVEIAFVEAGVEPAVGIIPLQDKPEWFTSVVNPVTKQIPAIAYGGPKVPADQPSQESVKLTESNVLLEFLADIYPSAGLLPKDPVQRAKARFFIEKVNTALKPAWAEFQARKGSKEPFLAGLEAVQSLLPESGFAIGEWSIADASVAPIIGRAEVALREDLGSWAAGEGTALYKEIFEGERFARLAKYWRDNQARESWKKTFNEPGYLQVFGKRYERS